MLESNEHIKKNKKKQKKTKKKKQRSNRVLLSPSMNNNVSHLKSD